jgi:hypothetical protein
MPGAKHACPIRAACDAADRNGGAEQSRRRDAVVGGAVAHLRQDGARHAEQGAQLAAPGVGVDVVKRGARRVGGVGGVHRARRQPPQQQRVHGAEGQIATLGPRPRVRHMVEEPRDLGGGEIGVEHQAGALADQLGVAGPVKFRANVGGSPILPDDCIVDRLTGLAVPDQRRLALVGDSDCRNSLGAANFLDRLARGLQRCAPKVFRIVLDPAGMRIDLGEFHLRRGDRARALIEYDRTCRSGALIDDEDMAGHGVFKSLQMDGSSLCQS